MDFIAEKRWETRRTCGFGIFVGVLWDYGKLTKESAGEGDRGGTRGGVCIH